MKFLLVSGSLFMGFVDLFLPGIYLFFIIPRLQSLYIQSGLNFDNQIFLAQIMGAVLLILGLINVIVGVKILKAKINNKLLVRVGILLAVSFVLTWLFIPLITLNVIQPIYKITGTENSE
jgi:hypothetical protein